MDAKAKRLFAKICGRMGSAYEAERAQAAAKATERLLAAGLSWEDVHVGKPEVIVETKYIERIVDRVVQRPPTVEEMAAWAKKHPEAMFWPELKSTAEKLRSLKLQVADLEAKRVRVETDLAAANHRSWKAAAADLRKREKAEVRHRQEDLFRRQQQAQPEDGQEGPSIQPGDAQLRTDLEDALSAAERGEIELETKNIGFITSLLEWEPYWTPPQRRSARWTLSAIVGKARRQRRTGTGDGQAAH